MPDFFSAMSEANVNHFEEHPVRHTAIMAVYVVGASYLYTRWIKHLAKNGNL